MFIPPNSHGAESIVTDVTMSSLPVALDPLRMQHEFQQLLFGQRADTASMATNMESKRESNRYTVTACAIRRVKYRAGEKCVISYQLEICDRTTGVAHEAWFCARVFPSGVAASRYQKSLHMPTVPPRFGDGIMFLPWLEMVIWAFPNDRKITGLAALTATATREVDTLDRLVADKWGKRSAIVAHQWQLIHYVPEHTCTVRVQLTLATPPTNSWSASAQVPGHRVASSAAMVSRDVTLFGKAYYDDEGAETYRLMHRLWHSPARQGGKLQIAQPLAYDPTTRLLWQLGLPGRTLLTYELGSPEFVGLLAEAAQAVAQLHIAALPCRRTTNLATWVALIEERRNRVTQVCPHLATEMATLDTALRCLLPVTSEKVVATLHGDLHLQNFFINEAAPTGQRLALIDLDNLSTGSPWHDIGSFCAGLYYRGLIDNLPQATIRLHIDRFLAGYAAVAPWPLDRHAINWYTAAALLIERAYRSISRMKDGRLALVDDCIRIANELLIGNG